MFHKIPVKGIFALKKPLHTIDAAPYKFVTDDMVGQNLEVIAHEKGNSAETVSKKLTVGKGTSLEGKESFMSNFKNFKNFKKLT